MHIFQNKMVVLLLISLLTLYFLYQQFYARRKNLPPGPMPFPLVGNTFQLDFQNMHKDMLKWKKKYGNIFTIWLPGPNIVINDIEVNKK